MTVVGVCGDVIHDWFDSRNEPTLYRPFAQAPAENSHRACGPRAIRRPLAGAERQALLAVDPAQPVFDLMTMRAALQERTIGLQYLAAIMTVFAALALSSPRSGSMPSSPTWWRSGATRSACASRSARRPPTSSG